MRTDSPGIPASASAYELFRGFSFVAPVLLDDCTSALRSHVTDNSSNNMGDLRANQSNQSTKISKCKGRTLSEYEFYETIGTGSYSICKRCVHRASGEEYAVKVCNVS